MNVVFYDVTRLISKADAVTPTGIDRVDIKYAYHLHKSKDYILYCIFLYQGVFYLYPTENAGSFLENLYQRWINGGGVVDFIKGNDIFEKYSRKATRRKHRCIDEQLLNIINQEADNNVFYLNTSHYGIGQIDAYYIFKTLGKMRIVFYLHDLIPIDYPEYVRQGDEITHQKRIDVMANFADTILVNSKYTEDCFIQNCKKHNYSIPMVKVLHIGVEDSFLEIKEEPLDGELSFLKNIDYFIYVGTIEPRKNHLMLLNVWRQYLSKCENPPRLVLLGKRGWNNEAVFDLLDRCPALQDSIIELHGVSDGVMVSLIKNSKGALFPTFVEGWGMPLVEAMSMKVPMIAADIPALREAGQNLAEYIDPIDSLGWKNVILKLQHDKEYRESCIQKSSSLMLPSWEKTFKELDMFLCDELNKETAKKYTNAFIEKFKRNLQNRSIDKKRFQKFERSLQVSQKETSLTITKDFNVDKESKFILFIFKRLSDSQKRKLNKFINNPRKFFLDSKKPFIKSIGNSLEKISSK